MMSLSDFWPIFLYEFKLNQSSAETAQKINQVFGNDIIYQRNVRRWLAKLCFGNFNHKDQPRYGRPAVIQDENLRSLVEIDIKSTVLKWQWSKKLRVVLLLIALYLYCYNCVIECIYSDVKILFSYCGIGCDKMFLEL